MKPKLTVEEQRLTESGIILPDKEPDRITEGIIVALGPKKKTKDNTKEIPYEVAHGDTVMFKQYGKERISIGGVVHRFVTEEDIILILSTDDVAKE